jgi:hypothetical protein
LIGWAAGTRERILNPDPFPEQANVVSSSWLVLPKVAFADAYDTGKEMTLAEAVAYSLAGS